MYKYILAILIIFLLYHKDYLRTVKITNRTRYLTYSHGIPKIVFRTTKSLEVSETRMNYCHNKWVELNPKFSFIWFTDKDQNEFMTKYFDGKVLDAYNKLIPGAYKSDLWRLCVLYHYGGIYVDEYAMPHVSIDKMLENCYNKKGMQFISVLDCSESHSGIHNGFIISESRHPFLSYAIEEIVKNVQNNYYGISPLSPTGPIALSNAIHSFLENKRKHRKGWNKQGRYSYYLYHLKWGPYQKIYKDNIPIVSKKYSFLHYVWQRLFTSGNYSSLWKNKKIYK